MISLAKQAVSQRKRREDDRTNKNEFINFQHQVPNSQILLTKSIQVLHDPEIQDLLKWIEQFQDVATTCSWDENTALVMIREAVSRGIFPIIRDCQTITASIQMLAQHYYPESRADYFYMKLRSLKQNNFLTIGKYCEEIQSIVKQLSLCKRWSDEVTKYKVEESFFNGLSIDTQIEMTKQNFKSMSEIQEAIARTEEALIHHYTEGLERNNRQLNNEQQTSVKWCSFHKVSTHDTRDCNRNKNKRGNQRSRTNAGNHVTETQDHSDLLSVKGYINKIPIRCLVDTGATSCFVSQEIANALNLELTEVPEETIHLANNSKETISKISDTQIKFAQIPHTSYKLKLKIMKKMSFDIILGTDFLRNNKTKIDFSENKLSIDGVVLDEGEETNEESNNTQAERSKYLEEKVFPKKPEAKNEDEMLCSKTKVCKMLDSNSSRNRLEEVLESAIKRNPELGKVNDEFHYINTTDKIPITSKPYSVPIQLQEPLNKELAKLVDLGVISKSKSSYGSPCFPILKKDGSIRLIIDYRNLNQKTEKESYPIPPLQTQLRKLKGARFFTSIDLNSGYYQIEVYPEHRQRTAFLLNFELYQFNRMPFGLTNAPRTFQRVINRVVEGLPGVSVYMDDVLIYTSDMETHIELVKEVLQRLQNKGFSVNFKKSVFAKPEISYLGCILNSSGIRANTSRVDKMENFVPKTKKHLMKVLGFLNWFRPFIFNVSGKLAPLTSKLNKKTAFSWKKEDQVILDQIYSEIKQQVLLSYPEMNKEFTIETDSSDYAIGGVVYQDNKLIGLYSSKLSNSERNYCIMQKESLAIVKTLTFFKDILFGNPIKIKTDNRNIIFFKKDISQKVQRWKLLLEEYDYHFEFIPGARNIAADFLSRFNTSQDINKEAAEQNKQRTSSISSMTDISQNLTDNLVLRDGIRNITSKVRNWQEENGFLQTQKNDGLKTASFGNKELLLDAKDRIVVPQAHITDFILYMHNFLSHVGTSKLYYSLKNYWTFPKMFREIRNFTQTCQICGRNKPQNRGYGLFEGNLPTKTPLETISSDIVGPFRSSEYRGISDYDTFFLITITDRCTRNSRIYFTYRIDSSSVINAFDKWKTEFVTPKTVITDNGRQYLAEKTLDWFR